MVLTILAAIFVFGLLVLVHEFGHFVTAKMTGMGVDEFAIGFGPKIAGFKRGETLYTIRCIPLGGYNKISGMDPEGPEAGDKSYWAKPVWKRMIVILAGSVMNFLLPIVLFFGIFFFSGVSTPSNEPVLGGIMAGKPAAEAGLLEGDRILSVNGTTVSTWKDFTATIEGQNGHVLQVKYLRNGEEHTAKVIPTYDDSSKRAVVGVYGSVEKRMPGAAESAEMAVKRTGTVIMAMVDGLRQIVTGQTAAELAGPLGVAQMAGEVAQIGFVPLLNFAALLSLNLGIVNLLPIPALDGGHFITLLLEAVRGKPLSAKTMMYVQYIGIVIVLGLMLFATFQDVTR